MNSTRAGTPDETTAASEDRDTLLQQLVRLTDSVEKLAQRTTPTSPPTTPSPLPVPDGSTPPERPPEENERLTVLFAYDFLGEVLGRRNFRFTPRVTVTRDDVGLTFTDLRGGTFARVRAANNQVEELENLVVNTRAELKVIPDEQAIDAIVVLERRDGVPVAIGNCQSPVPGVIVD